MTQEESRIEREQAAEFRQQLAGVSSKMCSTKDHGHCGQNGWLSTFMKPHGSITRSLTNRPWRMTLVKLWVSVARGVQFWESFQGEDDRKGMRDSRERERER